MDIIDLTPEPKEDWDLPKLQNLIKEKDEMEQEIRRITAELTGPGGPGLEGGLVDKDGFPIADYYKVVDVREKRGKLAMLQNDFARAMDRIEAGLIEIHQQAKTAKEKDGSITQQSTTVSAPSTSSADPWLSKPTLARVNSVAPGSPSEEAGLVAGDLVLKFGSADPASGAGLEAIQSIVMNSENRPIDLIINRAGQVKPIQLTPKKWSGRGLLGCHLLPAAQ